MIRPRACAAIIRNGKILMVLHRSSSREYWTLPGGEGKSFGEQVAGQAGVGALVAQSIERGIDDSIVVERQPRQRVQGRVTASRAGLPPSCTPPPSFS